MVLQQIIDKINEKSTAPVAAASNETPEFKKPEGVLKERVDQGMVSTEDQASDDGSFRVTKRVKLSEN
jgi:hypothetical protein